MSTTAAPPGDGQLPRADPPLIEQPPTDGPAPPDSPPPVLRGPWYRRGWVIALGALLVGAGIGSAAGSSKTAPRAATVTLPAQTIVQKVPAGPTRAVVHVRTVRGRTKTVAGPTTTVTQTASPSTPAPAASTPSSGSGAQNFSGNGSENLGTIKVPVNSTLTWSEPGGNQTGFAVSSDLTSNVNAINFDQHGISGKDAVSADTYTNVTVEADGTFTITITPNS
jgi:hypothetical protein